jgi:hypothetical protein
MTPPLPPDSEPVAVVWFHRSARWVGIGAFTYLVYFISLGPFWALDGRFDVVPEPVRQAVYYPATLWNKVPIAGHILDAFLDPYLDRWYLAPYKAETTR